MIKQAILAATLVVGATVSANAVPLFQDDFDGQALGTNASLSGWTVSNGSVDVVGPGFFDFYTGNGNYLDMDGSTNDAGRITTNQTFNLQVGQTYSISFLYGTNTNGGGTNESLSFGVGNHTFTLNFGGSIPALIAQTFTFIATASDTNVALFFEGAGGDNNGAILDKVSLSAVPLPAAAPLFLMGLAGLGAMARRRRAKISV